MSKSGRRLHDEKAAIPTFVVGEDGREVDVGDEVKVGAPLPGDLHRHEFVGQVVEVYPDRNIVLVIDQEDEAFEVDGHNVRQVA
jgi:hypothetical protein